MQSTLVYESKNSSDAPFLSFSLFLSFVCSLFFALNREASSLVFILTLYFLFYDLQIFISVKSIILCNRLVPATIISMIISVCSRTKNTFIIERSSYLMSTLGVSVNIWTMMRYIYHHAFHSYISRYCHFLWNMKHVN